jgi:type I restriction enzyme R subunit
MVIVRDMWLTGFDVPCLHTMYVDKPMRDHNLMQAIARVNRVFHDKEGGLVVDYIGIAAELRSALRTYTESKGKGQPALDAAEALAKLKELMDVARGLLHGFDFGAYRTQGRGPAAAGSQLRAWSGRGQEALGRRGAGHHQGLLAVRHAG